ncbi:MAG: Slp family lipoprotein [Rhodanobacter sp.]
MPIAPRSLLSLPALAFACALSACAPAPIFRPSVPGIDATPAQVAQTPERYVSSAVIWGGKVVRVSNLTDHSEIEILGYPLDPSQRPKANDSGGGRFIAVMAGYVEPLEYPANALITVSGRLDGSRAGKVGEATYVFPLVKVSQAHVWTAEEMRKGRSNVSFGVGLGVGIH